MSDFWEEQGCSLAEGGQIAYAWPPVGRFAALWERFALVFTDEEKHDLLSLLAQWNHAESTLVAYTDEAGHWRDVEPNWADVEGWLK